MVLGAPFKREILYVLFQCDCSIHWNFWFTLFQSCNGQLFQHECRSPHITMLSFKFSNTIRSPSCANSNDRFIGNESQTIVWCHLQHLYWISCPKSYLVSKMFFFSCGSCFEKVLVPNLFKKLYFEHLLESTAIFYITQFLRTGKKSSMKTQKMSPLASPGALLPVATNCWCILR